MARNGHGEAKSIRGQQDDEADDELGFDPATPPAPIDIHAFARRAGEIIARAALAFRGRKSER
jgi:hypothetical protein